MAYILLWGSQIAQKSLFYNLFCDQVPKTLTQILILIESLQPMLKCINEHGSP